MKQVGAEVDGRRSLPSWVSRLVSTSAVAALALIAAPGAKADVLETLNLMGDFGNFLGPLTSFTGAVDLDFSSKFTMETLKSISVSVKGHVFNQNVSLSLLPSVGIIGASDSAGDTLELSFAAPASGTWVGFVEGDVSFGDVAFNGASVLLGATGSVTRVGPPILPPPIIVDAPPPPPPIIGPRDPPPPTIIGPGDPPAATAPELSTWAMMLIGLAGLGLVAKRRRALGLLGGKA
jgi:MYXO-CTERM domain-containing protein